jgi:hypothetical protein
MTRRLLAVLTVALAGCRSPGPQNRPALNGFRVTVQSINQVIEGATRVLPVSTACSARYGGDSLVPLADRGTAACRYVIPKGEIAISIRVEALGSKGEALTTFRGPISFRVIPGSVTGDYAGRWAQMENGEVSTTVKALHQYGAARVWAEDAPPEAIYENGKLKTEGLPVEPAQRTFATGVSAEVWFEDQTLQSLQVPDGFDNRSSSFAGEFVAVGKKPESGQRLIQSCADDPDRNGQQALMVVTGVDPSGFFVSDISACRLVEQTRDSAGSTQVRTPEPKEKCLAQVPDGGLVPIEESTATNGICAISKRTCTTTGGGCLSYSPGTFASMFVFNFSFPEGLNEGDLLFTLNGSVQEFTSTTQMTFPSWTIAERVRTLPPSQWNKWLDLVPPVEIGGRICGMDDTVKPFLTDALCGHNRRNLKMESLESSLVKVRNVKMPQLMVNCDFNGNGSTPFFCESRAPDGTWIWTTCNFDGPEAAEDKVERECAQSCVVGNAYRNPQRNIAIAEGEVCAEESTYNGFGQFAVELNAAGPLAFGLDPSLPKRTQVVNVTVLNQVVDAGQADAGEADAGVLSVRPSASIADAVDANASIVFGCDVPVHYKTGNGSQIATASDATLQANTLQRLVLTGGDSSISFRAVDGPGKCSVSQDARARINVITRDAVAELNPNCRTDDSDPVRAEQCRLLRGARFDIVGHLKQVQPARPRWVLIPRSASDLCCHPGPMGVCPKPIAPCSER